MCDILDCIILINDYMDKILVFGDSISYGKWDGGGGWVARLREYIDKNYNLGKNGNFLVYNLGVPGELMIGLEKRFINELDSRVKPEEKRLVVFAIGVNDSCPNNVYAGKQTPPEEFKVSLKKMVSHALEVDCQVICIGLLPVNPSRSKGFLFTNEAVLEYDKYITEVCNDLHIKKIELFDQLMDVNFPDLLVDSVHPNLEGHMILLENIITFLQQEKLLD